MIRALALVVLLSPTTIAGDAPRDRDRLGWYVPDFARLQTGGLTGMINVGVGYAAFNDVLNVSLDYGYTPSSVAGRDVSSVTTQLSVRPFELRYRDVRVQPLYLGGGLLFGFGRGYFLTLPDRYEGTSARDTPQTAAHWMLHAGLGVDWARADGAIERHGAFIEVRTIDTYVVSYVENPRTVRAVDAFATALGYRVAF